MKVYKKDTKGKIRFIESYSLESTVYQISWLIDWKHTERKFIAKPKNVWKSNETSAEAQAALEAQAIVIKKQKEWFFTTIIQAENSNVIMPMLAKSYDKEKHKIDFNSDREVFIQPKFDWMRCLAMLNKETNLIELRSRKNRVISTLPHINEALMKHFKRNPNDILDWELYAHWLSFQENMKLIKKHSNKSIQIKYNIYDIIIDKPFNERLQLVNMIHLESNYLVCVDTFDVSNEEDIKKFATIYTTQWFEWVMIRHWTDWYSINKRSSSLLKYKDFIDITQTVVDVIPSKKCPEQWIIVLDWYKASLKMSHKEREEILLNKEKYIWQTAEIRFFEYTDDGLPRFPVCFWFRLEIDKTN